MIALRRIHPGWYESDDHRWIIRKIGRQWFKEEWSSLGDLKNVSGHWTLQDARVALAAAGGPAAHMPVRQAARQIVEITEPARLIIQRRWKCSGELPYEEGVDV